MTNLDGVFRREWGPTVAAMARWPGDLTVAEDAVQEACAEALRAWPRDGVPDNAGGWIVTVARNRALDRLRRESARPGKELAAVLDDITARTDRPDIHPVRHDELRMMFTCAHAALDRLSQLALTLRLISGLTVAENRAGVAAVRSGVGDSMGGMIADHRERDPGEQDHRQSGLSRADGINDKSNCVLRSSRCPST